MLLTHLILLSIYFIIKKKGIYSVKLCRIFNKINFKSLYKLLVALLEFFLVSIPLQRVL